ncbi:DUF72 domain-containing protein [Devosia rhizoryzae]|uniref:DUF72 domain-containing protein n=1 Tax=Devosia rhizoryzae TaxID=2774137 RepID=A0ABX7C6M2_9HYPH|nr:DUF72 domain-containing protein [Devosia rhizoryzae]QQR39392.1 DUF72 domain-containing protein [Devosia rhizoryzae]
MTNRGEVRTGTAGWVFEPWRGTFFPQGLVQKKELSYAASHLTTIEINATFRANQKPASFQKWASETPENFKFSIKGPQLVTHIRRLKNCRQELANFFASGPLALGNQLGPFVWQLPPNLAFDPQVLSDFLELLPRDSASYLALASEADGAKSEPYLGASDIGPIRHAIEPRHKSFDDPAANALFAQHNVARVIADTLENPGRELTADFAYCRLQGPAREAASGYEDADIASWAKEIATWREPGRDVFAYFVHEDKLHAPQNAMALKKAVDEQ